MRVSNRIIPPSDLRSMSVAALDVRRARAWRWCRDVVNIALVVYGDKFVYVMFMVFMSI